MIVLNQPPMSIPLDPLPGLFKRRGGNRGQQDPFQWLLSIFRLLFPDANDPHRHGVLARSRGISWWQERHLPKGKLQLGRTCLAPMAGWNLERTARLARPGPCASQCVVDLFLAPLYAPILGGSHQKLRLCRAARLEKREHISAPIPDMNPGATFCRRANGLHLAHPDIRFALFSLAPLMPLFSRVRGACFPSSPTRRLAPTWSSAQAKASCLCFLILLRGLTGWRRSLLFASWDSRDG